MERKFASKLSQLKPAAEARKQAKELLKETIESNKFKPVEPIDYDDFIEKNKEEFNSEPLNSITLLPDDDICTEIKKNDSFSYKFDFETTKLPIDINLPLLTLKCLQNYSKNRHLVHYKYSAYAGNYTHLPKENQSQEKVQQIKYEIDCEIDENEQKEINIIKFKRFISKRFDKDGWLNYKLTKQMDTNPTKNLKKRYFHLSINNNNRADEAYLYKFECFKDPKRVEFKYCLILDVNIQLIRNDSCLSFQLVNKQTFDYYYFTAESKKDYEDWIQLLAEILTLTELRKNSLKNFNIESKDFKLSSCSLNSFYFDLNKYLNQSDDEFLSNIKTHENLKNPFVFYPDLKQTDFCNNEFEVNCEWSKNHNSRKILLQCEDLRFDLSFTNKTDDTSLNPEPFFVTFALYDSLNNKKLSSNFAWNPNPKFLNDMINLNNHSIDLKESNSDSIFTLNGQSILNDNYEENLFKALNGCFSKIAKCVFHVLDSHDRIYLVARIEKILDGKSYSSSLMPYLKVNKKNAKTAIKLNRKMKLVCAKLGAYRMPFAWGVKPLFNKLGEIDSSEFIIYQQDINHLNDDELFKYLGDFATKEKYLNRLTQIDGKLKVTMNEVKPNEPLSIISGSYQLKSEFKKPIDAYECENFDLNVSKNDKTTDFEQKIKLVSTYNEFKNHLFIYPKSLKYDTQKEFSKARNIMVSIEFRENDSIFNSSQSSLKCIYNTIYAINNPSDIFKKVHYTCVTHHQKSPQFYEECKILLPINLTEKHHFLFKFYHIACNVAKTSSLPSSTTMNTSVKSINSISSTNSSLPVNKAIETVIGYAWLPIFKNGKLFQGEKSLSVAQFLPNNYLEYEDIGLGQSVGPTVKWVDGMKPLFKVEIVSQSTVYTTDSQMASFFTQTEKLLNILSPNEDLPLKLNETHTNQHQTRNFPLKEDLCLVYYLKALDLSQTSSIVKFLPILLDSILNVLNLTVSSDVSINALKALLHITSELSSIDKKDTLKAYIRYIFTVDINSNQGSNKTIHHQLIDNLVVLLRQSTDDLVIILKIFKNIWFVFEIILKSICLTKTYRIESESIQELFELLIKLILKNTTNLRPTDSEISFACKECNNSLANFIKKSLNMSQNRKFFFKLINKYLELFQPCDKQDLFELKFDFLRLICNHEHYIPLNLPNINYKKELSLTNQFRECHFLSGILLSHLCIALNESKEQRKILITILRNLLIKHSFDNRYANDKLKLAYISSLYVPLIDILMDNCQRLGVSKTQAPLVPSLDESITESKTNNVFGIIAGLQKEKSQSDNDSLASSEQNEITKSFILIRKDKLENNETKDLLICVIWILSYLNEEILFSLWNKHDDDSLFAFFTLLELSLQNFRYRGQDNILKLNAISKSNLMSPRISTRPSILNGDAKNVALIEANLCFDVSQVVLNTLSIFLVNFKDKFSSLNSSKQKLFDILFYLLKSDQSEEIKLKVFASVRWLIHYKSDVIYDGSHSTWICSNLCYELLKHAFNSKLRSIRNESILVYYLFIRQNYQFTKQKNISRVHLQTIITLSQLVGEIKLELLIEHQDLAQTINSISYSDTELKDTSFQIEVKELTKKIKTILTATSQLKEFKDNLEALTDLHYSLAKSYLKTPELRLIWLENMAKANESHKYFAETAYCYLHIAALIAENLKYKGEFPDGCSVFKKFAPNINEEESDCINDDINYYFKYTKLQLLEYLFKSIDMFKLDDRLEILPELFKIAIGIYERSRDYEKLQEIYASIQQTYSSLMNKDNQREKPLGSYYRVCFIGPIFEEDNSKVYIYRELGSTKLCEICDRLKKTYSKRYGDEVIEILNDSRKLDDIKLNNNKNYIQVTYVQPYFDEKELGERLTYYEKNTNIKRFYYELPYQMPNLNKQAQHNDILKLCKRKSILEASNYFPYMKKRIQVISEKTLELNPIETAIDELKQKADDLEQIIKKRDSTLLDLFLQGAVIPQVHKGPIALAEAFLSKEETINYSQELVQQFKNAFRRLMSLIRVGIELYLKIIIQNSSNYNNASSNFMDDNLNNKAPRIIELPYLIKEKFIEIESNFKNLLTEKS